MSKISLLLALLLMCSACGQDDKTEPTNDWDPNRPGFALQQGLYELDYSIREDTCSNSLSEIVNTPNWPPKYSVISTLNNVMNIHRSHIRAPRTAIAQQSERVDGRMPFYNVYASNFGRMYTARCEDSSMIDTFYDKHQVIIRSTDDNEITTELSTAWDVDSSQRCRVMDGLFDVGDGFHRQDLIPLETCKDAYTITYRLVEACPDTCRARMKYVYFTDDTTGQEYYRHDVDDPTWCECPE